jgi:long-chain acyl-CoA synthetase
LKRSGGTPRYKKRISMDNRNRTDWEKIVNLPQILKVNKERFRNSTALDSVDGTSYNYEELERSARFIASMVQSAGIAQGDRVAILSDNNPHWGIAYFGILIAGATTVPILPDFQGPEIISILEHSGSKALFVSGKLVSRLDGKLPAAVELVIKLDNFQVLDVSGGKIDMQNAGNGKLSKLNVSEGPFPGEESFYKADPHELASILYTSGTTGRSKGVMLSHNNILSNAKQSGTIHEVLPSDRFLSMLPLAHSYECTIGLVVPLLNGARIRYIDRLPTAFSNINPPPCSLFP